MIYPWPNFIQYIFKRLISIYKGACKLCRSQKYLRKLLETLQNECEKTIECLKNYDRNFNPVKFQQQPKLQTCFKINRAEITPE